VSWLVDTNVISELRKGERCDPGVSAWFAELSEGELFLSVLTIGELRRGIELVRRRDAEAAAALGGWLEDIVTTHSDRILPVDRTVAEEWGRLNVPEPIPVVDGLIAATARVHGLRVATRDLDDLERAGVDCHDPFA